MPSSSIFNVEQLRIVFVAATSPVAGLFAPTEGFIYALVIMFAFNIWAGMRADGISIKSCKNFRFSKFKNALAELFLYLFIIESIYAIMVQCGDAEAALLVVKSLTYVFLYVYLQNAFRNLITTYPRIAALHVVYHIIRLEFMRALPSYWQPIIDKIEREQGAGEAPEKS